MYMCVYIILLNVNLFILLQKEESVFFEKSQNYFKWFFFFNFHDKNIQILQFICNISRYLTLLDFYKI